MSFAHARVVALSGGVGGARLLYGLSRVLAPERLACVVNTGDDLVHWGLHVSPDVDTVLYTLGDVGDEARGWGLAGETFRALAMMRRYGGDDWFALGDGDLATHLVRTEALGRGESLTRVTARLARGLGIGARILPMADAPCRTMIATDEGALPFQRWFVARRAEPRVRGVSFEGDAPATPEVLAALAEADLVVIGPSNPYVSIDPILTRPGVREALAGKLVVAVSPIVGGKAVKGPLATMIPDLVGLAPGPDAIVRHYAGLLGGIVVEHGDEGEVTGCAVHAARTVMGDRDGSVRLAREVLAFAETLA